MRSDRDERLLKKGDVVFNNTNSSELVGKTAYYDYVDPLAFSNHMTRIKYYGEVLEQGYCAAVLHHLSRTGYFEAVCNNHVSQASVGQDVLHETRMALVPLHEQHRMRTILDALLGVSRPLDTIFHESRQSSNAFAKQFWSWGSRKRTKDRLTTRFWSRLAHDLPRGWCECQDRAAASSGVWH